MLKREIEKRSLARNKNTGIHGQGKGTQVEIQRGREEWTRKYSDRGCVTMR